MDALLSQTWSIASDDGPSPAARAFAELESEWAATAMLNTDIHHPYTSDNTMIFAMDDMYPPQQAPVPYSRTGTLDAWGDQAISAFTHLDQLACDETELDNSGGSFCLPDPNSFSGSPSSWDVADPFGIDHPLTPESPYHGDFGVSPGQYAPFSPMNPAMSSFSGGQVFQVGHKPMSHNRPTGRVPIRRTHTHTHSLSQRRGSAVHSPQSRPAMHMRTMSHSSATHTRPSNLTMSPRTARNIDLDAALAQPDGQLHFHHVIATPFSSSAPSHAAPIAGNLRRQTTPAEDKLLSAGEEDVSSNRNVSPERSADIGTPTRSRLHPPKQAPSTWQIFFTEYLQGYKSTNPERKLNVSQAAKDGGAAYKALSAEQKEIYKRKAQLAKEDYERELAAWQRTLTPDDIRQENTFRSAQRKASKSRRSNLKDPNAPKKPLSAYFMFLQWIRADPSRVQDVFGDETETTRQSVLAASKWRKLSDGEKKPFLAQAEREKLEYEAARKEYEERTTGVSNSSHYTSGYVPMPGTSHSWHQTSGNGEARSSRRGSSSAGKLAGGALFGAIVFDTGSIHDEEAVDDEGMKNKADTQHASIDETKTTHQSIQAPLKRHELNNGEMKPFPECENLDYEAAGKAYEELITRDSNLDTYTGAYMHMPDTSGSGWHDTSRDGTIEDLVMMFRRMGY